MSNKTNIQLDRKLHQYLKHLSTDLSKPLGEVVKQICDEHKSLILENKSLKLQLKKVA